MITRGRKDAAKPDTQVLLRPQTAGITIVEIIVAVAILAIFVAAAINGFSGYADRQAFNRYVNELELSVKEQRQRTLASVDDTQYGVYIETSTVAYFEGASYVAGAPTTTYTYLPNNITATSSFSDANWYVTFARLTGAASATGTITLFDSKTQRTATVTISSIGLVE